jgi:hypothetical protein
MDVSQWFATHLQASADGFVWAAEQVPVARRYASPPGPAGNLGEWVPARHVFHMLYYEQQIALPVMQHWLGASAPSFDTYDEDAAWDGHREYETMLAEFRAVRAAQIALLPQLDAAAWGEPRDTGWGSVTLRWVVSKTYQHTAEHTNDLLRMALFWDFIVAHIRTQQARDNISAT